MRRVQMVWGVLAAATVLVVGCGSKGGGKAKREAGAPASASSRTKPHEPFVIPEAGIRFNPPAGWDLARVRVDTRAGHDADAAHPGAEYSVAFDYRAEQPAHHDVPLVEIIVFRRTAWTRVADSNPSVGAVVDSTGGWVFVAALPDSNPYRKDLLDADQFDAMTLTFAEVREAFSVEDDGPSDPTLRADSKRP